MMFNIWAVLLSAASAFLLGGIWYSQAVFGKLWKRAANVSEDQYQGGHGAIVFSVSFVLALIAAFLFAYVLGPNPSLDYALLLGVTVGFGFVATSLGINFLFSRRSITLLLIDSGYHIVQFILYGLILGLWR